MNWDYAVKVVRVVDADTVDLAVDVGFRLTATLRFRLHGIDAPERGTPEGVLAYNFAALWLDAHTHGLRARTYKSDSFGRWLADLYTGSWPPGHLDPAGTSEHLGAALLDAGHARPWRT